MVWVVVPALDEAENLKVLVPRIRAALAEVAVDGQVLVVDDGSTDGTSDVVRAMADGALVGVHRISIVPDIISPAAMGQTPGGEEGMDRRGESNRGAKSRIPEKYASIDTSDLRVDVQKGMPPVTFELTKN